jgi:glycosyltransferase involved in cell wall biosynthesis
MSITPQETLGPAHERLKCLSVVMPALNEGSTIADVVSKVLIVPYLLELVIVDDCSTDNTPEIVREMASREPRIVLLRHNKTLGKTQALKTGLAVTKGAIVIVQDADLEYDPDEIPSVIEPILKGHADVVFSSRFLTKKTARVLYFSHYLANKCLTFLSNCSTNLNMSDIESGYKAFRGDIIRNMVIISRGFGFEVETVAKVAKLKCAIYEVPISYYGRTYAEGKKIKFSDGLAALFYIVRFNWLTSLDKSFQSPPVFGPDRRLQLFAFDIKK